MTFHVLIVLPLDSPFSRKAGMTDSAEKVSPTRTRLVYRLDSLTIDVGTAEVRRGDQPVPLPRLSFDLLLALVKAAPNLVTVDELMDQVWPGVVVNADTVSQRIKLLRLALDDDPKQPRYIAVSRGRGYRIVGQVTAHDAVEVPAPSPDKAPESPRTKLPRWTWVPVAALALAGLASLLYMQREQHRQAPGHEPWRLLLVTHDFSPVGFGGLRCPGPGRVSVSVGH